MTVMGLHHGLGCCVPVQAVANGQVVVRRSKKTLVA